MKNKFWEPLEIVEDPNPNKVEEIAPYRYRKNQKIVRRLAFRNNKYNGWLWEFEDGSCHVSFKRNDRAAARDWREFMAIKNDLVGLDREAVEIYPSEFNLVDAANEYHLWIYPRGFMCEMGFEESEILEGYNGHDHAEYRMTGKSGATQREFDPNLPVGVGIRKQIAEVANKVVAQKLKKELDKNEHN